MKKKLVLLLTAFVLVFGLAACGGNGGNDEGNNSTPQEPEKKVISVGVRSAEEEQMVLAAKDALLEMGYEDLKVVMFDDNVGPNTAVYEGSIDANAYQYVLFLDDSNASTNYNLKVADEKLWVNPLCLVSNKIKTLDEISDGMTVAISNDASNIKRQLEALQDLGYVKIKEGIDMPTIFDLEENPYNLEFVQMVGAQVLQSLDDVDFGLTSSRNLGNAGIALTDSVWVQDAESAKAWGNVLVVKDGNEDAQWAKDLAAALHSDPVRELIEASNGLYLALF